MTNQALPNLAAAIKARRNDLADIPKAAQVAWWQLQAALAAKLAEDAARGFAPTQPFVRSPVFDLDAARHRAAQRHAEQVAWVDSLRSKQ